VYFDHESEDANLTVGVHKSMNICPSKYQPELAIGGAEIAVSGVTG
jgi:hypothetical protein